jgi:hypothetical protein
MRERAIATRNNHHKIWMVEDKGVNVDSLLGVAVDNAA